MSSSEVRRCDEGGWLVPSRVPVEDRAWREGEPVHGCGRLRCARCQRLVIQFPDAILGRRPDDRDWLDVYESGGFGALLAPQLPGHDYRLYVCGCRAYGCGSADTSDNLAIDDDLPWACEGHAEAPAQR